MSQQKITRQRKAERKAEEAAMAVAAATPVETPPGDSASTDAPAPKAPAPRLETDDLMALASMDPSELAALMDGAMGGNALETGESVTGQITSVTDQQILVDIGRKAEAWMERDEVPDAVVGMEVTAFVLHAGESAVRLSTQLSGDAASAHLDEAKESGIPVEGKVASRNGGGFEVRVGDVRAFCPISLIARHYVEEPDVYVGQTLQFRVIETGDKIVLSRRALEEERAAKFAEEFWGRVVVDQELDGVIRSVQSFGAFVDLGGVDGLIPKRELSWSADASVSDLVAVGEPVRVRIMEIDRDQKRLTLTLKNPEDSPWHQVGVEFVEGGIYEGKVVRITTFGAFVKLADGLDGLAHTSRFPSGMPTKGDTITVRILAIDEGRRRISLAPAVEGEASTSSEEPVQVSGHVAEVMRNGVVLQLEDGRTGWLPASEVELPAGTVLQQRFRRGKRVTARVVSTDGNNRVTVTQKTQVDDSDWRRHVGKKKEKANFGTLGDLFSGIKL